MTYAREAGRAVQDVPFASTAPWIRVRQECSTCRRVGADASARHVHGVEARSNVRDRKEDETAVEHGGTLA
eukprot:3398851-Rhodomonas_salina.3